MARLGRIVCFVSVLVVSTLSALAQSADPKPDFYTLRKDSGYESGCFAPCMCPIMIRGPVRGGFRLSFIGSDGLFDDYLVEHVEWVVRQPSGELHVSGSGSYRIGGQFARQHQLSLDLQVGEDPVQHFDSGLVVPTTDFPAIDARISINGEYCHDTVFEVHARPVRDMRVDGVSVSWDAEPVADGHDVVWGSLRELSDSLGNFAVVVAGCLANDIAGYMLPFAADPAPGDGFFFLLRDVEGGITGSFDSGSPSQVASRDDSIEASPSACP